MQRAADKNFDKFELYALNNVFRVPTEVSEAPEDGADQSGIDAELEELWAQLRQELATKSELQQRVAAASRETQRWEAHQHTVEGLCTTRRSEALVRVLHEARQLDEELRRGREQLHGSTAEGPACMQKALVCDATMLQSNDWREDLQTDGNQTSAVRAPARAASNNFLFKLAVIVPAALDF